MSLVNQLLIEVHRILSHDCAQAHTAVCISLISFLRLEDKQEVLLLEVLLVRNDWLDGQDGATCLPQWLGVVVDV
jgi:hypothetical protein